MKATRIFLSDHGIDAGTCDLGRRGYIFLKQIHRYPGDKKLYPRLLRCRRSGLRHAMRMRANSQGREKTEIHDALILDLTDLSLSQYTEVRKMSQSALLRAVMCFQGGRKLIFPSLLKALESSSKSPIQICTCESGIDKQRRLVPMYANTEWIEPIDTDYESMKGALHLLTSKSLALTCLRDWRYVPEYILLLCKAHHADKPSVQALVRRCFLEYLLNLTNASFKVFTSGDLSGAVKHFCDFHLLEHGSDALHRLSTKSENRRLNSIQAYENLIVSLTELLKDESLHWRYQAMVMGFLDIFLRPEIPVNLDLAQIETKGLLSEMPAIRSLSISTLTHVMLDIKVRTNAQGDPLTLATRKAVNPLTRAVTLPNDVPDDFTWEYLKASVTEINYQKPESW